MVVPRSFRLLTAAAVAAIALSSCSKSMVEAPSTVAKEPVFEIAPVAVSADTVPVIGPLSGSAVIDGGVGGRLAVGPYRVEVPAGAYKGVATITITQPDRTILQCDLSIDPPAANQFLVPVTLAVKLPNTLALTTDQNMWLDPSLLKWRLIPTMADDASTELRSPLWHFSKYGTGRAGW